MAGRLNTGVGFWFKIVKELAAVISDEEENVCAVGVGVELLSLGAEVVLVVDNKFFVVFDGELVLLAGNELVSMVLWDRVLPVGMELD